MVCQPAHTVTTLTFASLSHWYTAERSCAAGARQRRARRCREGPTRMSTQTQLPDSIQVSPAVAPPLSRICSPRPKQPRPRELPWTPRSLTKVKFKRRVSPIVELVRREKTAVVVVIVGALLSLVIIIPSLFFVTSPPSPLEEQNELSSLW